MLSTCRYKSHVNSTKNKDTNNLQINEFEQMQRII